MPYENLRKFSSFRSFVKEVANQMSVVVAAVRGVDIALRSPFHTAHSVILRYHEVTEALDVLRTRSLQVTQVSSPIPWKVYQIRADTRAFPDASAEAMSFSYRFEGFHRKLRPFSIILGRMVDCLTVHKAMDSLAMRRLHKVNKYASTVLFAMSHYPTAWICSMFYDVIGDSSLIDLKYLRRSSLAYGRLCELSGFPEPSSLFDVELVLGGNLQGPVALRVRGKGDGHADQ